MAASIMLTGCGNEKNITNAYQPYQADFYQNSSSASTVSSGDYYTKDICVTTDNNLGNDQVSHSLAESAGVFNLKTHEVTYSQNIFEKLYPASTTKILTAYIIISNCNLDDTTTVSKAAVTQTSGSSVCGLKAGDVITIKDLLYGLLLDSGNDAAAALAEYYSGSVKKFAKVMNQTAKKIGATKSHFVNPHGLPDEDHYTTVYDMYLIFANALKLETFEKIISSDTYTAKFNHGGQDENSVGESTEQTWKNTNQYLTGEHKVPENFKIVGGKTGTTNAAGYCLVLYSHNSKQEPIISIVFKGTNRSGMYDLMDEILTKFGQ